MVINLRPNAFNSVVVKLGKENVVADSVEGFFKIKKKQTRVLPFTNIILDVVRISRIAWVVERFSRKPYCILRYYHAMFSKKINQSLMK